MLQTNLGQYIPGLEDLKQGVGETERQAVNARITASLKNDSLSEPPSSLLIHVEVFTKYTESDWESVGFSRSVITENKPVTSQELIQFLLNNLRLQARRLVDQIPLKPNYEFWDIGPRTPAKQRPCFVDWAVKQLLSEALQLHGFNLDKQKSANPSWQVYLCCRPLEESALPEPHIPIRNRQLNSPIPNKLIKQEKDNTIKTEKETKKQLRTKQEKERKPLKRPASSELDPNTPLGPGASQFERYSRSGAVTRQLAKARGVRCTRSDEESADGLPDLNDVMTEVVDETDEDNNA